MSPSPAHAAPGRHDDAALRAKLARAVGRACPAWARAHEDDIVEAAMLRVVEARASREGDEPLPASYLWKVAYTATIDELRRLRARGAGTTDGSDGPDVAGPAHEGPHRRAQGREISAGIVDCLGGLVASRRQAVGLYLQGHTVPETARLLAWTPKRAENLVYRGLGDLRKCLEGKGLTP